MTTLANNPITLAATTAQGSLFVGARLVVVWSCTRRRHERDSHGMLERVRFMLSVQPLDREHAVVEAWLESADTGMRMQTILQSTSRPCTITCLDRLIHMDIDASRGLRLLTLSMTADDARIVYAQTPLVREAGFSGGVYDPPLLQCADDERVAQTA